MNYTGRAFIMKHQLSDLQKAFFNQAEARDKRLEKTRPSEADIAEAQNKEYNKHLSRLMQAGSILDHLESSGANDKSEIHEKFKNYNHSLEKDRASGIYKPNTHTAEDNDYRPVERDGKVSLEVNKNITIDSLLERT